MNTESIILRKEPNFIIIINENDFEIINEKDKNDSGVFLYRLVDSIKLKTKRLSWFVVFLDVLVGFIFNAGFSTNQKEKERLDINYNGDLKQILLTDCDMIKAEDVVSRIKHKVL